MQVVDLVNNSQPEEEEKEERFASDESYDNPKTLKQKPVKQYPPNQP